MLKLKKPKTGFDDWMRERSKDEYCKDMERLAVMLYHAAKKKSELDIEVKVELIKKLRVQIDRRHSHRKTSHSWSRWDGRNWRGAERVRQRLIAAGVAEG